MATYQNKNFGKSDQVIKEQLRSGRKALKYVRRKSSEMQGVLSSYLSFPDISSSMSFIESLGDLNSDSASSSGLSE
jgi:hypothetical protein